MRLPLLLTLVLGSLFAFSACPEVITDPPDPDTGGGAGGGSGGGGGNAIGSVRIQHKSTAAPGFLNLAVGTVSRWNPSYLDGGVGSVRPSPDWFEATQVTDSLTGSAGTVSGTYSSQRVDGGVVISFSATASRGTDKVATMALTHDDLLVCITGATGSARLDVSCEGTHMASGSGFVGLLVGDPLNDGKYCKVATGVPTSQGALPTGGTETAALVQGERCFTVGVSWVASFDASDGNPGASSVAGGKISIAASLVP